MNLCEPVRVVVGTQVLSGESIVGSSVAHQTMSTHHSIYRSTHVSHRIVAEFNHYLQLTSSYVNHCLQHILFSLPSSSQNLSCDVCVEVKIIKTVVCCIVYNSCTQ